MYFAQRLKRDCWCSQGPTNNTKDRISKDNVLLRFSSTCLFVCFQNLKSFYFHLYITFRHWCYANITSNISSQKILEESILKSDMVTNLTDLPRDVLNEVLCKVASASLTDLLMAKQTCKTLLAYGSDRRVWQHISLAHFPFNISWLKPGQRDFFLKCVEHNNIDSLFRLGMRGFFDRKYEAKDWGIEHLKAAATEGHMEAKYIYNVISGEEVERVEKMSIREILQSRNNLREYITTFWIKYERVELLMWDCWLRPCGCAKSAVQKKIGWPNEDVYDYVVCSEACIWSLEGILLCDYLLEI